MGSRFFVLASEVLRTTITRENITYPAVICDLCGTKVYPESSLQAHLDYHEVRILLTRGLIDAIKYHFAGRIKKRKRAA